MVQHNSKVDFNINDQNVSEVTKLAAEHLNGLEDDVCIAITATLFEPNKSKGLCYGFCFPKKTGVRAGGVYKNDDGSLTKIVNILC
jgi:hypothetical protein